MRIGGRPFNLLRAILRRRVSTYTVTRTDSYGKNSMGETTESTTSEHDTDLWVHAPNEINIETEFGERLEGDLLGLALGDGSEDGADLQVNDEITHGGETYEVDDIVHLPHDDDKQIMRFSLVKVTNDT